MSVTEKEEFNKTYQDQLKEKRKDYDQLKEKRKDYDQLKEKRKEYDQVI